MTTQDRINIKDGAKAQILSHFSFYVALSILWLALSWVQTAITNQNMLSMQRALAARQVWTMPTNTSLFLLVLVIVATMLRTGAQLTMIDIDRGVAELDQPIQRSFKLFEKGQYFWGWLAINLLSGLFIFLWSCLLIIPGMVKAYAYSQAFYIYRDALDQGHPISPLQAITQSRYLMDDQKFFLFVMDLSFILWMILGSLFWGLPGIFVMPYYDMSRAKFYNQLVVMRVTADPQADESGNGD